MIGLQTQFKRDNHTRSNVFTNYQGLTGIGLTIVLTPDGLDIAPSGTTYQAMGVSRTGSGLSLVSTGWYPQQLTILDSFRLVSDAGDTLLLHQNTHITVNANGTYTALVDNPRLECK